MSNLSTKEIEKIAQLARMELTNKEKERFSRELSDILGYVGKLQKVNTQGIEETSQVTGSENVYRKDIADEKTQVDKNKEKNREKLLKNAPTQKEGYIKVKAVLE